MAQKKFKRTRKKLTYERSKRRKRVRAPTYLRSGSSIQNESKFTVQEKVLCYEPDFTKARVLYDAKILDIAKKEDGISDSYLVHFVGWSTSWDRWVDEEMILRDTWASRELQIQLRDGIQMPKKKKKKTCNEDLRALMENSEGTSSFCRDTSETSTDSSKVVWTKNINKSSDSPDEDSFLIDLPSNVIMELENDGYTVLEEEKLHDIPSVTTVQTVLNNYLRIFAYKELSEITLPVSVRVEQKPGMSLRLKRSNASVAENRFETLKLPFQRIQACREVIDGLQIIFDAVLYKLLLYDTEIDQYIQLMTEWREAVETCSSVDVFLNYQDFQLGSILADSTLCYPEKVSKVMEYFDKLASSSFKWPKLWSPSALYPTEYLLRLFEKLPKIFADMYVEKEKMDLINYHVKNILDTIELPERARAAASRNEINIIRNQKVLVR